MTSAGDMILAGLAEALAHAKGEKTGARETVVLVETTEQVDAAGPRGRLPRRAQSKRRGGT
jgi:hypothetical protein